MKIRVIVSALVAAFAVLLISGCASSSHGYPYESCRVPVSEIRNHEGVSITERRSVYDRLYTIESVCVYTEEGVLTSSADKYVEKFNNLQSAYTENFGQFPAETVYINHNAVTHIQDSQLWLNPSDSAEYSLAVILAQTEGHKLPFGIYAGIAANIYAKNLSFEIYSSDKLALTSEQYGYCNELQFPLYYADYSTAEERTVAWNFSLSLVSEFSGNYSSLLNMSESEFSQYVVSKGIVLPEYSFYINDSYFPVKIVTENYIYYVQNGYVDQYIDEEDFKTDYLHFKTMLAENERFINNFYSVIGTKGVTGQLEVYLGNEILTALTQKGGQAYGIFLSDYKMVCRTLGALSYHSAYATLKTIRPGDGKDATVWTLSEVLSTDNLYYRLFSYRAYNIFDPTVGNYDNYEQIWTSAKSYYDSLCPDGNKYNFDTGLYIDCLTYAKSFIDDGLVLMAERASQFYYLCNAYGTEAMLDFYKNYKSVQIGEKGYDQLSSDWQAHILEKFSGLA